MAHLPLIGRRTKAHPVAALVLILITPVATETAVSQTMDARSDALTIHEFDRPVAEAARRFGLPAPWIHAVMKVESAGDPRAVSRAGAIGLMQIMPGTWADLSTAHDLGDDPFDPRDNIRAGAAYLRMMYDRFGAPGFLAAYNAGPTRYQKHLATGRPLPRETRAYLATLLPMIGLQSVDNNVTVPAPPPDWREAPLFVERSNSSLTANPVREKRRPPSIPPTPRARNGDTDDVPSDGVIVAKLPDGRTPR